jgi:transcription initiation factor TFIIF subunit beta
MVGTIANEAALKPQMSTTLQTSQRSTPGITPEYREVLRKRRLEAAKPKHSVKVLDDADISKRNMLFSGVGSGFTKGPRATLIPSKSNEKKNQVDKMARMPRNELLDMLFELFEEYPYWAIKGLRNKVQQPEVYLREVLMTVADYHRVGPYASLWSLKAEFKAMRKQGEASGANGGTGSGANANDGGNNDNDRAGTSQT